MGETLRGSISVPWWWEVSGTDASAVPRTQIINETLPALQRLKEQGRVRHIGITGLPLRVFPYILDRWGLPLCRFLGLSGKAGSLLSADASLTSPRVAWRISRPWDAIADCLISLNQTHHVGSLSGTLMCGISHQSALEACEAGLTWHCGHCFEHQALRGHAVGTSGAHDRGQEWCPAGHRQLHALLLPRHTFQNKLHIRATPRCRVPPAPLTASSYAASSKQHVCWPLAVGPRCTHAASRCRVPPGSVDVVLSYCHLALNDRSLEALIPYLRDKGVGIINASVLSMGLLTPQARAGAQFATGHCHGPLAAACLAWWDHGAGARRGS